MRTMRLAWVPCVALLACSSSSSGGEIVGEWTTTVNKVSEEWFFNSGGSCGVIVMENNTSACNSNCTYTFNGSALTVTLSTTSNGTTTSTTYDYTVDFVDGGGSASITGACDSSVCLEITYTRVNSNDSASCP
jgi:hypothetical protein